MLMKCDVAWNSTDDLQFEYYDNATELDILKEIKISIFFCANANFSTQSKNLLSNCNSDVFWYFGSAIRLTCFVCCSCFGLVLMNISTNLVFYSVKQRRLSHRNFNITQSKHGNNEAKWVIRYDAVLLQCWCCGICWCRFTWMLCEWL